MLIVESSESNCKIKQKPEVIIFTQSRTWTEHYSQALDKKHGSEMNVSCVNAGLQLLKYWQNAELKKRKRKSFYSSSHYLTWQIMGNLQSGGLWGSCSTAHSFRRCYKRVLPTARDFFVTTLSKIGLSKPFQQHFRKEVLYVYTDRFNTTLISAPLIWLVEHFQFTVCTTFSCLCSGCKILLSYFDTVPTVVLHMNINIHVRSSHEDRKKAGTPNWPVPLLKRMYKSLCAIYPASQPTKML